MAVLLKAGASPVVWALPSVVTAKR
jgi:hypothetical protein